MNAGRRRTAAAFELAWLALLFAICMWWIGPRVAEGGWIVALYWALVLLAGAEILYLSPRRHHDPAALRGWPSGGPGAFSQAWPVYAGFTAAAAILLLLAVLIVDPARLGRVSWDAFAIKFVGYLVFGFLQSLIFFGFVLTRLRSLIPYGRDPGAEPRHRLQVAAATAAIFTLIHLPNLPLMAVALAGGFGWALIFYRRPNLLLLGLSHAVLGTILHRIVQLNMRIGPFYADPDRYILRAVIPWLNDLIGGRF